MVLMGCCLAAQEKLLEQWDGIDDIPDMFQLWVGGPASGVVM
jgi:hypothetical protein